MTADTISEVVGPERTIGCVVELSSEMFTPGLVKRNTPPQRTWIGLGSLTPRPPITGWPRYKRCSVQSDE